MRSLFLAAALAAVFAAPALAHPDHDAPGRPLSDGAEVSAKARTMIDTMIERKVLDASWRGATPRKVEYRTPNGRSPEWVVTFANPKATDTTKRALYVMFNPWGDYLAANHTGN